MTKRSNDDSEGDRVLPCIEVSGTHYEMGYAIGNRFGENIREAMRRRSKWFGDFKAAAKGKFAKEFEACVAAAKKHFPQYVEELQGWADGAGVPLEDLMIVNNWAELNAMNRHGGEGECSTVSLNDGKRIILAHNEDSSAAYRGLMFWLKAQPKNGRAFQCFSYPFFIPGNSPGFNDAGVIQTTNYTPCSEWRVGIPRYFLNRAIFDAASLDDAIKVATHPERGYGNHHNLTSTKERRLLSVEVTPSKYEVHEVKGVYFHTNHLILDSMKGEPQFPGKSSLTRHAVLSKLTRQWNDPTELTTSDIIEAMCNHEEKPNSVCRHGRGYTAGVTLGTAVFEIPKGTFRMYNGNPCSGNFTEGRL